MARKWKRGRGKMGLWRAGFWHSGNGKKVTFDPASRCKCAAIHAECATVKTVVSLRVQVKSEGTMRAEVFRCGSYASLISTPLASCPREASPASASATTTTVILSTAG